MLCDIHYNSLRYTLQLSVECLLFTTSVCVGGRRGGGGGVRAFVCVCECVLACTM